MMKWRYQKVVIAAVCLLFAAGCKNTDSDSGLKNNTNQIAETVSAVSSSKEVQTALPEEGETVAVIHVRDYGDIKVKFFSKSAPKAVTNFLTHAKDGYYDGVIFHRVMDDFMIQGGDPDGIGTGGESIWGEPFEDECVDDLLPIRGALCMANRGANTNGSQFFIVQTANSYADQLEGLNEDQQKKFLQYGGTPWLTGKHTVFGQVYEGIDIVDAIAGTDVDSASKPKTDVVIESIEILEYGK